MNRSYTILVATGLGKAVGDLFVSDLGKHIDQQFPTHRLYARFVDVCDIVPVLRDSRKVADILLHALLSPRDPPPDIVLVPCNSVHIASPHLRHAFRDRFVPIDEAVMTLINREGRKGRFLILGTSTTVESGIYQEGLRRLGCESLVLPSEAQAEIDDFIFNDLVNGKMDASHLNILRDSEHRYMPLLNADHVILACTELCYLVQVFSRPLPCEVDSLRALHDAGIERLQAHVKKEPVHAY